VTKYSAEGSSLLADRRFDSYSGNLFQLIGRELQIILQGVWLDSKMISHAVAIGGWIQNPIGVHTDKIQQLPAHHRDFCGVNAIRAEDCAAAAFGALIKVVEPLLDNFLGQISRAGQRAKETAREGKVTPVNGTQQLRAEYRHVLRVRRAEIEMALVRARSAANTYIHEKPERAKFL
jgi:hypothetical protein